MWRCGPQTGKKYASGGGLRDGLMELVWGALVVGVVGALGVGSGGRRGTLLGAQRFSGFGVSDITPGLSH